MNAPEKFVVWDWNGTLQDDLHVAHKCANLIFEHIGRPSIDEEMYRQCFDVPIANFYRNVGLTEEEVESGIAKMQDIFFNSYAEMILTADFRPGGREILDYVKQSNIIQIIISNHMTSQINADVERLRARESFFDILAQPDRNARFRKSKKDHVVDFMEQHKLVPQNGVIIGDTPEETHIARELGLTSVAIMKGYASEERLRAANPDYLIHSLHELKPIMQEKGLRVMNAEAKTIVFDWNGTLLDDTASVLECVNLAIASVGRPPVDMQTFSDGHNWPLTPGDDEWPLKSFYRDMGLTEDELVRLQENERHIFHDNYEMMAEQAGLRPGTAEVLGDFHQNSIQSLILSNHLIAEIRKQLKRFSIEHYFAEVLAYANRDIQFKDMTKGERLRRFMQNKNLNPQNMMIIGDTIEEIEIARELGLASIAITGGIIAEQRLRDARPDHLIHSLHELKPILQERGFVS